MHLSQDEYDPNSQTVYNRHTAIIDSLTHHPSSQGWASSDRFYVVLLCACPCLLLCKIVCPWDTSGVFLSFLVNLLGWCAIHNNFMDDNSLCNSLPFPPSSSASPPPFPRPSQFSLPSSLLTLPLLLIPHTISPSSSPSQMIR